VLNIAYWQRLWPLSHVVLPDSVLAFWRASFYTSGVTCSSWLLQCHDRWWKMICPNAWLFRMCQNQAQVENVGRFLNLSMKNGYRSGDFLRIRLSERKLWRHVIYSLSFGWNSLQLVLMAIQPGKFVKFLKIDRFLLDNTLSLLCIWILVLFLEDASPSPILLQICISTWQKWVCL